MADLQCSARGGGGCDGIESTGMEDLVVLYDELAFPLGTMKIAASGSANGHNGVKSVTAVLGTDVWTRVRIGVGKPPTASGLAVKAGGTSYLLAPMRPGELDTLEQGLELAVRAVEMILVKGVSSAMNEMKELRGNVASFGSPRTPTLQCCLLSSPTSV